MVNVAVIGAGIMGMSTAYRLKLSHPSLNVTVIAKEFSPNTTSDGAAGFWKPFLPGDTPQDLVKRWSKETYDFVMGLIKNDPYSSQNGLTTTHGYVLFISNDFQEPYWADFVCDYHKLTKKDLNKYPDYVKSGFGFTTLFIEGQKLIPWYTKLFEKAGGTLIQNELTSFSEVEEPKFMKIINPLTVHKKNSSLQAADEFDIIVNCAGLGSRSLVDDKSLIPNRGQILKVRAPWVKEFTMLDTESFTTYILPNQNFIVLGGTKYINDSNLTPSLKDKDWIVEKTKELLPSLELAEPIGDWVGLRPYRSKMRIEAEKMNMRTSKGKNKQVKIVHNYGHGGSGLTVHWGCAGDTVALVSHYLLECSGAKTVSRL